MISIGHNEARTQDQAMTENDDDSCHILCAAMGSAMKLVPSLSCSL